MAKMSTIYAVMRASGELKRIGKVKLSGNWLNLTFNAGALDSFDLTGGDEPDFRSFILLGQSLDVWPGDRLAAAGQLDLDQSKVWANPIGKRVDHRPTIWRGGPVEGDQLAVLVPAVKLDKLGGFEPKQDGFFRRLPGR